MTDRPTQTQPLDSSDPCRVVLSQVSKRFSAIRALDRVDLELRGGEIHALCGENGAGKSTLIQILGGVFRPDSGRIEIGGKPVRFGNPAAALAAGIGIIHQELNLVELFTVAENLALGHEPRVGPWIDRRTIHRRARRLLEDLQFDLDTRALVSGLTIGQRQQVEIAKALGREVRILVLDEPTAALSRAETDQIFRILQSLRARGLTILYVSHHLEEVFEIADRITVLRDGRRVGTWKTAELTLSELVAAMVGWARSSTYAAAHPAKSPRLPCSASWAFEGASSGGSISKLAPVRLSGSPVWPARATRSCLLRSSVPCRSHLVRSNGRTGRTGRAIPWTPAERASPPCRRTAADKDSSRLRESQRT